jgi:hypothetical protein
MGTKFSYENMEGRDRTGEVSKGGKGMLMDNLKCEVLKLFRLFALSCFRRPAKLTKRTA